jgi:simple sugar transport system ATP-binding protein
MAVTDRVTVLRQGSVVAEHETAATSADALAAAMIGRQPETPVRMPAHAGAPVLTADGLTLAGRDGAIRLDGVTLAVHAGEILGVAGVAGNGQTELIEALTGLAAVRAGSIALNGEDITALSVSARRRRGLGHIAEDRLRFGAIAEFSAAENALLGRQDEPAFAKGGWLRRDAVLAALSAWMQAYDIRPPDPARRLAAFSGGNQQKLVAAREIERRPAALVVGQPTRGVDIGATELIHRRLLALRAAGAAILLVSADLDEIRLLADRILVLCNGRIAGELAPGDADERRLGMLMAGADAA